MLYLSLTIALHRDGRPATATKSVSIVAAALVRFAPVEFEEI
jgi:hypothetical protein